MSDYLDTPLETSEQRALRMWSNYAKLKRMQAEKKKEEEAPPVPTEPEIAELIKGGVKADDGRFKTTKFERKFAKDLRGMLEKHKRRNVLLYRLSLVMEKRKLLWAKLKRLEALEAHKAQLGQPARDLFQ
jgi:hypothetical protein